MKRGHVYLLRSLKDKLFHLGWTTDLKRRFDAHNKGKVRSTKAKRPFEMVHYEIHTVPELAKVRERQLKQSPNMYKHFRKRALLCASTPQGRKEVVG